MSEMVEVLETVYVMEGVASGNMARDRAKQIFDELDLDGDGTLTCDEFIKGCMKDEEMVDMLKRSNCPPDAEWSKEWTFTIYVDETEGGKSSKMSTKDTKLSTT